jgi:uncharacterized protein YbjT (DUF2867 family)
MLHHRNVVNAAKGAGVKHIIYTSVVKPQAEAFFAASPGHFHTEVQIRESGIPYTFSHPLRGDGRIGFVAARILPRVSPTCQK